MSFTYDYYDAYGRKQPRSPRPISYYYWNESRPSYWTFTLRIDDTQENKVCVNDKDNGEFIRQRRLEHEESQREVEKMVKRKRNGVKIYRKKCAHKQIGSDDV